MARDLKRSLPGSIGAGYDTTALCFLYALIASSQGPHGKPGNNHTSRLPHPARHPTRTRFEHAPHSLPSHTTRHHHHHCCGQSTTYTTYLPTYLLPSVPQSATRERRKSDARMLSPETDSAPQKRGILASSRAYPSRVPALKNDRAHAVGYDCRLMR